MTTTDTEYSTCDLTEERAKAGLPPTCTSWPRFVLMIEDEDGDGIENDEELVD